MKYFKLLLLSSAMFLLAACGHTTTPASTEPTSEPTPAPAETTGPIKIGVITPLSGGAAHYGEDAVNTYEMIANKVNADGGINGQEVKLILEDGKCTSKDAVSAVQKLINVDKVQVIIGGACSTETLGAGPIAQEAGVVMISPTASSPEVSKVGDYIYRYWNDINATKVLADYVDSLGSESAALIYQNEDYAVAYASAFKDAYKGEIVLEEKVATEEKDFSLFAQKIMDKVDEIDHIVVVINNAPGNIAFVKALDDAGMEDIADKLVASESVLQQQIVDGLGELAEGLRGVTLADLADLADTSSEFIEEFTSEHEILSADMFIVLEAEALMLALDAIEAGGNDASEIQKYVSGITESSPRTGLFGEYYFDEFGDGQGLGFSVKIIENGEFVKLQ